MGDGLPVARPAEEPPEGLSRRGRGIFFLLLVTILQLGYGRNPGLDAVGFKAAVLIPH